VPPVGDWTPFGEFRLATNACLPNGIESPIESHADFNISLVLPKLNWLAVWVGVATKWNHVLVFYPHSNNHFSPILTFVEDPTAEYGCLLVYP